MYQKVSEVWEIWTGGRGETSRKFRKGEKVRISLIMLCVRCPVVQLVIKGWSSSEKTRNKEGEMGVINHASWLGSKSGSMNERDQIASDEALKNIHSHSILSETNIFYQSTILSVYNKFISQCIP